MPEPEPVPCPFCGLETGRDLAECPHCNSALKSSKTAGRLVGFLVLAILGFFVKILLLG